MSLEKAKKLKRFLREVAEGILALKRGMQGLPIDPDTFSGLINPKDIRERTRLGKTDIWGHSLMRLVSKTWGEEWGVWENIADMEDHYYISEGGEGRKEGIEMTKAKTQEIRIGGALSVPTSTTEKKKEKKHFWQRGEKEKGD